MEGANKNDTGKASHKEFRALKKAVFNKEARIELTDEELSAVKFVFAYGAKKYGKANCLLVMENAEDRLLDAFERHLYAIDNGEECDKESGLSHYAHAIANLLMLDYQCSEYRIMIVTHKRYTLEKLLCEGV